MGKSQIMSLQAQWVEIYIEILEKFLTGGVPEDCDSSRLVLELGGITSHMTYLKLCNCCEVVWFCEILLSFFGLETQKVQNMIDIWQIFRQLGIIDWIAICTQTSYVLK